MRRQLVALGLAGTLLLVTIAIAAFLLGGLGVWFLMKPVEQRPRAVEIARVTPLLTPVRFATSQKTTEFSSEGITAAIIQALPTEKPPIRATPTPTPSPTILATATATPLPGPTSIPAPRAATTASSAVTQKGIATRLVIHKLGLDRPVVLSAVENGTWRVDHLGQAVGHLEGTARAGSTSNIVLAGHVTLATGEYGPFAGLGQLTFGDLVTVYEGDAVFNYRVESLQVVGRTSVEVAYPSETGEITLITCTNWNSVEGRYIDRVVVKGHLVTGS